jgi:hypothetical protein
VWITNRRDKVEGSLRGAGAGDGRKLKKHAEDLQGRHATRCVTMLCINVQCLYVYCRCWEYRENSTAVLCCLLMSNHGLLLRSILWGI